MGSEWSKELPVCTSINGDFCGWHGLDQMGRICHFKRMDLANYQQMDPHLLVGLVNTELRNSCESLEDLVKTHNLEHEILVEKLKSVTYEYRPEQNQFR